MARARKEAGFAENPQRAYQSEKAEVSSSGMIPRRERTKLGEGGRFVIPAGMRADMGVKPGDDLIMYVEDGELRVRSWRDAIRRVQEKASRLKKPGESVVDDFLKGRRAMWGEE